MDPSVERRGSEGAGHLRRVDRLEEELALQQFGGEQRGRCELGIREGGEGRGEGRGEGEEEAGLEGAELEAGGVEVGRPGVPSVLAELSRRASGIILASTAAPNRRAVQIVGWAMAWPSAAKQRTVPKKRVAVRGKRHEVRQVSW